MASWDNVQVPMQSYASPLINMMQFPQRQQQPQQQMQQPPQGQQQPLNLVPPQVQPSNRSILGGGVNFAASPMGRFASGLSGFLGGGQAQVPVNTDPNGNLGGLY